MAEWLYFDCPCHVSCRNHRYVNYNPSKNLTLKIRFSYVGLNICVLLFIIDRSNTDFLINSLATLSTFITTVLATSLIASKIVLVTRKSHMRHSYTKIIAIVIESGTLTSIVLLCVTILGLVLYARPVYLSTYYGRVITQMNEYFLYCQGPTTVCIYHHIHCNLS